MGRLRREQRVTTVSGGRTVPRRSRQPQRQNGGSATPESVPCLRVDEWKLGSPVDGCNAAVAKRGEHALRLSRPEVPGSAIAHSKSDSPRTERAAYFLNCFDFRKVRSPIPNDSSQRPAAGQVQLVGTQEQSSKRPSGVEATTPLRWNVHATYPIHARQIARSGVILRAPATP
jgi:hypothetical protein